MKNQRFWRPLMEEPTISDAARRWNVPSWLAEFLLRRGVAPSDLETGSLANPGTLADMEKAAHILQDYLRQGERVRIYGDYDADGVTATALLTRTLAMLGYGGQVDYYIPNRFDEGYGLHEEAVLQAHADGVRLMVTVDCGSSSVQAAAKAQALGLGLIITDHHALPEKLPVALALVNPEQDSGVDKLSGAGVALQLARQLLGDDGPELLWGIAAVGTVADVVPLMGGNRCIVKRGLGAIRQGRVPGLAPMFALAGRSLERATEQDIAFFVGPRLNAAGRMGDAEAAVQLLMEDDARGLEDLASTLSQLNQERQMQERLILSEAWQQLPRDGKGRLYPFPVVAGEGWHEGVIGIVASRLRERLQRPVAVVAWDGEEGKGSARGIEGFNLIAHLRNWPEVFTKLGGHPGAAGFSLKRQDPAELSRVFSRNFPRAVCERQYRLEPFDLDLKAEDSARAMWGEFKRWAPFGRNFESPRFLVRGLVERARGVGSDSQHLQLSLKGQEVRAIGFGMGPRAEALSAGEPVRFVARLESNWYRGQENPQWRLELLDGPWPRRQVLARHGLPPLIDGGNVLWIVDSDRLVAKEARRLSAAPYLTALPLGELIALEEQARLGLVGQVVVSQWRPWPGLLNWADIVVWLCWPRNQGKWEESASLMKPGGTAWIHAHSNQEAAGAKSRRLRLSRERLGRHWRGWQSGNPGLIPGRAIFQELELTPSLALSGERRSVADSHLYRMAALESRRDQEWPFLNESVGEEEMHGLD